MPDVRGLPLAEARQVLRDNGFTEESRTKVAYINESGCAPGKVCRTYPEAMQRSVINNDRLLYVGAEPGAR